MNLWSRRAFSVLPALSLLALSTLAHGSEPLRGVIEASALKSRLGQPGLVVVDIRSGETRELGRSTFAAGHIPGAVHGDYAHAAWRLPRGNISVYLPEPAQFEVLAGDLGISNDDSVVIVHEGTDATSFGSAARAYWTFKAMGHASIAILDGGYHGWVQAGYPVEKGEKSPSSTIYEAKPVSELRAKLNDVLAAEKSKVTLVDSRPESFFSGLEKHRAVAAFGHIPGAINVPHHTAFRADFRLKDKASLAQAFSAVDQGPTIAYCNTGHWAATDWFVLSEVLGRKDVRLFDGSMLEYASEQKGPVANPRAKSGT
ncbi:SseA Rhodanese-related sulfurtransferase [Rhabdaerophilaceae bacterium]